jgi:hypothetical protein
MLRSFGAAALVVVSLQAFAAENAASLTVPASSLVFKGEGLQAPDEEGNFGIGIKLPIAHVKASKCDTPYLATGLGTMNKPLDELSDTDKKTIAHVKAEYDALVAASKAGKTVTLHFRNTPTYLRVTDGVIYVPYCILSMVDAGRSGDD